MSEEEIIKIDKDLRFLEDNFISDDMTSITVDIQLIKDFRKLINLVNKQKEEIKELKLITNGYDSYLGENMGGYKIIIADSKYFLNGTFVEKYVSKDKIKEILDLAYKDNYEMVKLPNNEFMCVSDCANLLDYLKELVEENESIE